MGQRLAEAEETIAALNEKLASLEKSKGSTGLSVLMPRLCELAPRSSFHIEDHATYADQCFAKQ